MSRCVECEKCRDINISKTELPDYYRVTIKGKYSITHSKDELIGLRTKLNDLDI
jgi:hypothetical protein